MRHGSRSGTPRALVGAALVGVLAFAGLVSTRAALGQTDPGGERFTFDLHFPGGTLEDYLRLLLERSSEGGRPQNIIANDWQAAREVEMPGVDLRAISVSAAVSLVERVVNAGPFRVDVSDLRTPESDTYVVTVQTPPRRRTAGRVRPAPEEAVALEVFSLADLVAQADDAAREERLRGVIAALTTALEIVRPAGEGDAQQVLRYHADTGLLFFKGGPDETATVATVLDRLRESSKADDKVKQWSQEISRLQEGLKRAIVEREVEAARHKDAREQLLELERANQRLTVRTEQFEMANAELRAVNAQLQEALAHLRSGGE